MRVFINGEEVFLASDTVPSVRICAVDLTDIGKVRGNTSTTIKVALTPQSRRILGDQHAGRSPNKVTDNSLVITDDAGQEIYRAQCAIVSVTRDSADLIAVSGNAYWIEWAKRTKLRDLVLNTTDSVNYNGRMTPVVSNGISVQSNVAGGLIEETWTRDWLLYYPLIDYGSLKGTNSTHRVAANTFRPGVRLWKLLEAAFQCGGFTLSANVTLKERLSKLILITNTNKLRVLFDPDFQGLFSPTQANGGNGCGLRQTSTSYTLTQHGTVPSAVGGSTVMYDTQGNFSTVTQQFTIAEDCELIVRLKNTKVIIPTDGTFIGKRFRVVFWDATDGYEFFGSWSTQITAAESTAGAKFILSSSTILPTLQGHVLFFAIQIDDVSGLSTTTVTVSQTGVGEQVCLQYVVDGEYDQFFTAFQLGITHRVIIKNILPDITVADLVSSTVAHQGLCMVSEANEVRLEQLDDYLGTVPMDITGWIDHTISLRKEFGNTGKMEFRWKDDENDEILNRIKRVAGFPGYGNADVVVGDGRNIRSIELKFTATAMDSVLGGKMLPAIRKDGGTPGVNSFDISTRLLADGGIRSGPVLVGTSNTYFTYSHYPFTYFVKDTTGIPMAFDDSERHWCPGFVPNTSPGVLSVLHQKEAQLINADTILAYVSWPKGWLRRFPFGQLFTFMDGLSTVHAYVNSVEYAGIDSRFHRTEFVLLRSFDYEAPTNPPVEFPPPPVSNGYRRCVYWVDYRAHMEATSPMAVTITSFLVDGVEKVGSPITLPATGSYIMVDGYDYWTNLVDALNGIDVEGFQFDPYGRVAGEAASDHGQYMSIARPEHTDYSIVLSIGSTAYRYTPSGVEMDLGSGWEAMYNYMGLGYEGAAHLCELLHDLPTPPSPPPLRRCSFYQDFTPYALGGYNGGYAISSFTLNGVERGGVVLDEDDHYITVDGRDFYTNLIDALNSIDAPWSIFAPTAHLGGTELAKQHGGWFTITYRIGDTWEFVITDPMGSNWMRYTNSGVSQWNGTGWDPYNNLYGDGEAKNMPRNCTDL